MQIVIDIPEVFYEALRKTEVMVSGQRNGKTLMSVIYNAVANGTPLPEGHGKLIDINEVKKKYPLEINGLDLRSNNQCLHTAMDEAQSIIEADTKSENDSL